MVKLQGGRKGLRHAGHDGKVADITHADTNKHTITLATMGLPQSIKALQLLAVRIGGAGNFNVYPAEGTYSLTIGHGAEFRGKWCAIINNRLQYSLNTANDDFDLYCVGYLY